MKKETIYNGNLYQVDESARIWYDGEPVQQHDLTSYVYITRPELAPVHRIVAAAYCEVPAGRSMNELQVDHIDGDTKNNFPENLRWVSRKQNNSTRRSRKLRSVNFKKTRRDGQTLTVTERPSGEIRRFKNYGGAAEFYGCTKQAVINWTKESRNPRRRKRFAEWIDNEKED